MTKKKTSRITGAVAIAGAAAAAGVLGRRALRNSRGDGTPLPPGRALITGASSGIGETFARRLASQGYDLTLVARREEKLSALARELERAHGVAVAVLAADLARDEDIGRVSRVIEESADLVLLINNAGFGTRGSFSEVPLQRHIDMIRVHDIATVALTWAALPGMTARGRGAIINVSSVAAFFPSGGGATYTATKAYLNNFSEALAHELRDTGVRVQALCPGFTYSEFHETADYEGFDRGQIPKPLWMSAEDVVDESLAALSGDKVIVVPGRQYRGIMLAVNSPLRGTLRSLAQAVRRRWHPDRGI